MLAIKSSIALYPFLLMNETHYGLVLKTIYMYGYFLWDLRLFLKISALNDINISFICSHGTLSTYIGNLLRILRVRLRKRLKPDFEISKWDSKRVRFNFIYDTIDSF